MLLVTVKKHYYGGVRGDIFCEISIMLAASPCSAPVIIK